MKEKKLSLLAAITRQGALTPPRLGHLPLRRRKKMEWRRPLCSPTLPLLHPKVSLTQKPLACAMPSTKPLAKPELKGATANRQVTRERGGDRPHWSLCHPYERVACQAAGERHYYKRICSNASILLFCRDWAAQQMVPTMSCPYITGDASVISLSYK